MSIEYFFKVHSSRYARSGFENHFLPEKRKWKSKNSFHAKGRGSGSPLQKGARGRIIPNPTPFA